jgi:rubredoxin
VTPAETPRCAAEKENFTGLRRVRKGWEKGRCKSCGHEYYVDGDDPMDSVAEYAEHSLHAHRLIAEKDARIRELEGG